MDRMRALRTTAVGALAVCGLALAPGAAQARIGDRVDAGAARPAVVHAGAKDFQYCTAANGCWTALFIYSKTKEFEAPEASIYGGKYVEKKVGRARETVFTTDDESGAQCIFTGVKNNKGYSSEANPGSVVCKEGEAAPYIEEAWWAVRV